MIFYVLDENNNKHEALDREGVLNAIETAIRDGNLANLVADAGFISKLKCCVSGATNKMGFITQAQYNQLERNNLLERNTLYFITDDTLADDLEKKLVEIDKNIKGLKDGSIPIDKTKNAENAEEAETAKKASAVTMNTTFEEMPLSNIFEYGDDFKPTGRVWEAVDAEKISGTKVDATTNSLYGSVVPLKKAGLYVCTIKQTYKLGSTTSYSYLTALISVPNLKYECSTHIVSSNSATADNRLVIYYSTSGKYLQLYDNTNDDTYSYEFYNCQLITEY